MRHRGDRGEDISTCVGVAVPVVVKTELWLSPYHPVWQTVTLSPPRHFPGACQTSSLLSNARSPSPSSLGIKPEPSEGRTVSLRLRWPLGDLLCKPEGPRAGDYVFVLKLEVSYESLFPPQPGTSEQGSYKAASCQPGLRFPRALATRVLSPLAPLPCALHSCRKNNEF